MECHFQAISKKITDTMDAPDQSMADINIAIKASLKQVKTTHQADNTMLRPPINNAETAESQGICPYCDIDCDEESTSVLCDLCNTWIHKECEDITDEVYASLEADSEGGFICRVCLDMVADITERNSSTNPDDPNSSITILKEIANKDQQVQDVVNATARAQHLSQFNSSQTCLRAELPPMPGDARPITPADPVAPAAQAPAYRDIHLSSGDPKLPAKCSKCLDEKQLRELEKQLKKREIETTHAAKQFQAMKMHSTILESRVKELERSNHNLKLQASLEANQPRATNLPAQPTNTSTMNYPPQNYHHSHDLTEVRILLNKNLVE